MFIALRVTVLAYSSDDDARDPRLSRIRDRRLWIDLLNGNCCCGTHIFHFVSVFVDRTYKHTHMEIHRIAHMPSPLHRRARWTIRSVNVRRCEEWQRLDKVDLCWASEYDGWRRRWWRCSWKTTESICAVECTVFQLETNSNQLRDSMCCRWKILVWKEQPEEENVSGWNLVEKSRLYLNFKMNSRSCFYTFVIRRTALALT